ncbi:PaaX family transcriptional regulator [Psychrobacter immobilis]|uniref:PaaX family transcriptional regulator n=1 Tax=Psychrobacter immobilis TaxID=498 RepID=UPI0019191E85|nr:PaaX family transcriptional regulator [Psychrobacter immobilis]
MESYFVKNCNISWPTPRLLLLRLLTVADEETLTVAEAVRAGALFDMTENSVRVTMARLTQAGLVEAVDAAIYRLGAKGQKLGADVAAWSTVDQRVTEWDSTWIAVTTGGLPRSDRKVLRARARALSLLGFRELDTGLYLRPNNLSGGVDTVRARLLDLGLGEEAAVFKASVFDSVRQEKALSLWSDMQLEASYKEISQRLNDWLATKDKLPREAALRDVYLLGDAGIRSVIFDPLLPAPLVNETERQQFFATVRRFNNEGRRLWYAFFKESNL